MLQPIHIEAVERILSAVYASGDNRLSSFLFGKPGAPHWGRRRSTEIFVRRKDYIRALLFVRQNGAPYLRAISISDLWSMVTHFLTDNFWYVCGGEFTRRHDCSYAEQIAIKDKIALADALAMSAMFEPRSELTLYPLLPIRVAANFESEHFFLLNAADLSTAHLPHGIRTSGLVPTQFPPVVNWEGRKHPTTSWLGVRSPLLLVSHKMASAILGAVALTPLPRERHLFSGRTMFGGRCTITNNTYSISGGDDPHTPPMMHDIVLTEADHDWLAILATLLDASDKHSRSQLRALEYFYRAWFLDPHERFPALCMSLDSLVSVEHGHTAAAVKYVRGMVDTAIDSDRLRLLMRVRGAVIHGAAPDVYDSENYEKYYADYETDPIRDLELIVAKCLREAIFGATLKYHPDPNAELLASMQAMGRLPARLDEDCIIGGDV
jgi:hypothetical protein